MKKMFLLVAGALLLAACASTPNVTHEVPGAVAATEVYLAVSVVVEEPRKLSAAQIEEAVSVTKAAFAEALKVRNVSLAPHLSEGVPMVSVRYVFSKPWFWSIPFGPVRANKTRMSVEVRKGGSILYQASSLNDSDVEEDVKKILLPMARKQAARLAEKFSP